MTQLTAAVDTASLWLWTGGWRTYNWARLAHRITFRTVRGMVWALMLVPFLLAAAARAAATGYVRAVWAAGWAAAWTVAAFAAGWAAAGERDDGKPWA